MWEVSRSQFVVFVVTCIVVLATDLLIGIGVGILVNMIFVVAKGQPIANLFKVWYKEEGTTLYLKGGLSFTNYLGLKKKIASFYEGGNLVLDFSEVNFVDHNVMHHLEGIQEDWKRQNKSFELIALDELTPVSEIS